MPTFFDGPLVDGSLDPVESRKAWRNRDPSAGEAVMGLLEALRIGFGADAAGLFDDDRAELEPDARRGAINFWDSFGERACAPAEWDTWYRTLRADGHIDSTCRCGGPHLLHGSVINGRWLLLVIVPLTLPNGGQAAIASALRALSDRLPPAMTPEERRQLELARELDETIPPTPTDAPVWWIRKRTT
jgi:hypothetical protein